uniref:Quinone oxidoreductase PIG3 n=1 Tax=Lygus hesperus TaxID=30085 RepID=A0A0A9Z1M7_LYGHE
MQMMRAITLKGFGEVDMLQLSRIPKVALSRPTDVLIKVMAAGVNRADISQRRGHFPPPKGVSEVLGLEVSGVVECVGDGVHNVKEGDKVMALLSGGGYA